MMDEVTLTLEEVERLEKWALSFEDKTLTAALSLARAHIEAREGDGGELVEISLSDMNDLDAVVHALGIEDSHVTPTEAVAALQAELAALKADNERLTELLRSVMHQSGHDLKTAHAEICKLQGLDPETHDWPEWTPQANTLRWFEEIRASLGKAT